MEQTFAMIKPDAVRNGHTGAILTMIQEAGFTVKAMKQMKMTKEQAEAFYGVHSARPFFPGLVGFISSGPVVVLVLEKDGAIAAWRELMGATNPANAAAGTIRQRFAKSIDENAAHGSDAPETAEVEKLFFFTRSDIG
jgi:nucleoside-diphosphate kinase